MADPLRTWFRCLVVAVAAVAAGLSACATPGASHGPPAGPPPGTGGQYMVGEPYEVRGVWYYPQEQPDYDETGTAGIISDDMAGRTTADGEVYDPEAITGSHTTLPMPVMVEVTNLDNGETVQLRINDRGPFDRPGAIISVSRAAAVQLGFPDQGTANVRVRYVGPAPLGDPGQYANDGSAPQYLPGGAPPPSPPPPPPPPDVDAYGGYGGYPPPPPPPESFGGGPGWTVQAGSFTVPANAQRAVAMLTRVAPAEVVRVQIAGRTFYRVILGPWPAAEEAARARDKAALAGFPDAIVKRPR